MKVFDSINRTFEFLSLGAKVNGEVPQKGGVSK